MMRFLLSLVLLLSSLQMGAQIYLSDSVSEVNDNTDENLNEF